MKTLNKIALATLLVITMACTKEEPHAFPEFYVDEPIGNFLAFWEGMSKNYAFWGYDTVNWDRKLSFSEQITDSTSKQELADIFEKMVEHLIDHHFVISAEVDGEDYPIISKTVREKLSNALDGIMENEYFENVIFSRLSPEDRKKQDGYVFGTIDNKIQYVRIPGFGISQSLDDPFFQELLDFIDNPKPFHKGIIFDVRHNGGGLAADLQLLAGRFTKTEVPYGHIRQKVGSGRQDYGPWIPVYIKPNKDGKYNPLPVVVLCDNISISMAEQFSMAMACFPQVTTVGVTTFGAHAPLLLSTTMMMAGSRSFYLPNGWKVQVALEIFRYINGELLEGKGYTPEVIQPLNVEELINNGKDTQLDKAIQLLL